MRLSDDDMTRYRAVRELARERYSERILGEAAALLENADGPADARFRALHRLLLVHGTRMEDALREEDVYGKINESSHFGCLSNFVGLGLLTDAELEGFSEDVRTKARMMANLLDRSMEIYTRDPNTVEDVPPPRMLTVLDREVEVRIVTGLRDEYSEARGLAPCHVGVEVDYLGDTKIVETVKFERVPGWEMIMFEVERWIYGMDPWSWQEQPAAE